ncbi:MAG: NAD-dependent epimerase/dehydratase family protein [Elusimicrobia bacterium]|nr:NAD-dependent epimerase/dehydratase family protein [Elusimicrobiota bacterium]
MKALVTGGSGFLGSHIVEALLKNKYSVKCLVRNPKKIRWLHKVPVETICGDCSDKDCLAAIVSDVDYIFHSAALVRAIKDDELYSTNVAGTRNLIEAVSKNNPKIKRFVYISSQAAVGPSKNEDVKTEEANADPVSHYGFSKLLGESEVLKFKDKLPVTILRPPSIYGPRDKDVFAFFKYTKNGILPVPKEEKFINISFVSDVVDGILLAAGSDKAIGQTYFIGDDKIFSWRLLCDELIKAVNPNAKIIETPDFIFYLSALFGDIFSRLNKEPALISLDKLKEMKQKSWLLSVEKAKKDFGYSPKVSLEEGIKITYNWYLEKGWL